MLLDFNDSVTFIFVIYKILKPLIFIPTLLRSKFTQKDDVDLPGGRKEPHRPAV